MTTIAQKLEDLDWEDPTEHLVALAYLAGQEKATKDICDIHNRRLEKMRNYANSLRYHKMANTIIDMGQEKRAGCPWTIGDGIYSGHYAGDVTTELCADEWPYTKTKGGKL